MKRCSRCRAEILDGQLVCPQCGKLRQRLRRVRCRACGSLSSQDLATCPECGERLRQDWLRPAFAAFGLVAGIVLGLLVGPSLLRGLEGWRPGRAFSTVQAMVSDVPVLVKVPTLTPSLTPSITPSPTNTPTSTPRPSATPSPTLTPAPTMTPTAAPTDTPSPTPTRTRRPATPTQPPASPTPWPTAAAPILLGPEDGSSFGGAGAIIHLAWQSAHALRPGECFLVTLSYLQEGAEVELGLCVREPQLWVRDNLYLQADQETGRAYHWSVAVALEETDGDGNLSYITLGPASEERTFYWP